MPDAWDKDKRPNYKKYKAAREEAREIIENFTPEIEDIQIGFDVDLPSLFFRQIERINFSVNAYPDQFPKNVQILERMLAPYFDPIYKKDLEYLNVKKNIIFKKLLSRHLKLSKKVFKEIDRMIAEEKYQLIMYLSARIGMFPMREGTLIIDHDRYVKLRDAFITYYSRHDKTKTKDAGILNDDPDEFDDDDIEAGLNANASNSP